MASASQSPTNIPHVATASSTPSREIPVPSPITESFCLLSLSSLPDLKTNPEDVVFLQYPTVQPAASNSRRRAPQSDSTVVLGPDGHTISRKATQEEETEETREEPNVEASATYDTRLLADLHRKPTLMSGENPWPKAKNDTYVRIAYIKSLETDHLKAILDASYSPKLANDATLNLITPHIGTKYPLLTGLHLRFFDSSELMFFLGIPYLGGISTSTVEDYLTLYQYPPTGEPGLKDNKIRVWQAWHVLFDNTRIAIFKSGGAPAASSAPLFPFQERFGTFHALVQLVGNHFLHEDAVLSVFKRDLDEQQQRLLNMTPGTIDPEIMAEFDQGLTDLSTVLRVINDQLKILKDFERIVDNHCSPRECYPARNAVELPFLKKQSEQIKATLLVLKALATERTAKIAELKEWKMELRDTRKGLHTGASLSTSVAMRDLIQEQGLTSVAMKDLIARQGQTVTVFALVTAAFLPLNFFATYLGMNVGVWSGINTHEEFWRVTGPITVVLVAMLSYFMFRDDNDIKRDMLKFMSCLDRKKKT